MPLNHKPSFTQRNEDIISYFVHKKLSERKLQAVALLRNRVDEH